MVNVAVKIKTGQNFNISLKSGTKGLKGDDGRSAYEIALDNGFVGTEIEWLDSLKGTGGAGAGTWGEITGEITEQTDLKNALDNKVDKADGKGLSTEDYTTAEKLKLSGLQNYEHPITHSPSIIAQDINNRFVTDAEKAAWNNKLSSFEESDPVFNAHPAKNIINTGNGTLFLSDDGTYKVIQAGGGGSVDLTNYYNKIEVDTALELKVDADGAKVLSDNNYTNAEKLKLAGLENYSHPVNHSPLIIVQDTNNRFVSDAEKTYWNEKQGKIRTLLSASMSAAQSLSNSVVTTAAFNTVATDVYSAYNNTAGNYKWVAPYIGLITVQISGSFASNATGQRAVYIAVNGSAIAVVTLPAVPSGALRGILTKTISVNTGDYVQALVYQTSGGALNLVNDFASYFEILGV